MKWLSHKSTRVCTPVAINGLGRQGLKEYMSGFFHKIFGDGGDLLSGMIFAPHRGWSQMRGDLEKLSAEAKYAPLVLQQNQYDVVLS